MRGQGVIVTEKFKVRRGIRLCIEERPGNYVAVTAEIGGEQVGRIGLGPNPAGLSVRSINVNRSFQRRGIATALYEEALSLSCEKRVPLLSDFERSRFEEAFWSKQKKKGRAVCKKPNPDGRLGTNYFHGPIRDEEAFVEEECYEKFSDGLKQRNCVDSHMKALLKSLPKPRLSKGNKANYWPCGRYVFKKGLCAKVDLSGLRP